MVILQDENPSLLHPKNYVFYIYVSYYDTTAAKVTDGVAFVIGNTEKYGKNYQTDFGGETRYIFGNVSYKNSYSAISSDLISAIGTYFHDIGEKYSFDVYVNNVLKLTQNGSVAFSGFHTIKLTNEIPIKKGDTIGKLYLKDGSKIVKDVDLVSDADIRKAGLFKQYFGVISDMFSGNVY